MTLLGLAGLIAVSLIGPLLAMPRRTGVPIVVGELAVGVVLGTTGLRVIHPNDPILSFLAQAGFGMVMLVAGTHVPIGNRALRKALRAGLILAVGTGVIAVPIAAALSSMAHTHHTALYAVLLSSSSAAVIMPIVQGEGLVGNRVLTLMAQVAIADTACIIALPLAAEPSRAGRAAVGAVIVLAVAGLGYLVLRELAERNLITKLQNLSVRHNFGIEMRVSLAALFGLAGLAVNVHVSVMLAGFAFGLVLSAIGTPRRLAGQLFAVSEGFLGPIFFIWLGASIDLRALVDHPRLVVLAVGLAAATTAIHALARLLGQPLPLALLASAQLGVPIAAVALGAHGGLLQPGEGGAILGAAVLTLGVTAVSGAYARRATTRSRAPWAAGATQANVGATAARPSAANVAPSTASDTRPAGVQDRPAARPKPLPAARVKASDPSNVKTSDVRAEPFQDETAKPAAVADAARPARVSARKAAPDTPPPPSRTATAASTARPANTVTPTRTPTPNPATKPIVQSNVRVQPAPQRPARAALPQQSRPARSDDDN